MKSLLLLLMTFSALTVGMQGQGKDGKISGKISGAHCGINAMACAPSHDLKRAELPGVLTGENRFFFVVNVPQAYLAQWPGRDIVVGGTVHEKERAVHARTVSVRDGKEWKTVYEDGYVFDGMGHKVKLADAVEIDGAWYCGTCAAMHR